MYTCLPTWDPYYRHNHSSLASSYCSKLSLRKCLTYLIQNNWNIFSNCMIGTLWKRTSVWPPSSICTSSLKTPIIKLNLNMTYLRNVWQISIRRLRYFWKPTVLILTHKNWSNLSHKRKRKSSVHQCLWLPRSKESSSTTWRKSSICKS